MYNQQGDPDSRIFRTDFTTLDLELQSYKESFILTSSELSNI